MFLTSDWIAIFGISAVCVCVYCNWLSVSNLAMRDSAKPRTFAHEPKWKEGPRERVSE